MARSEDRIRRELVEELAPYRHMLEGLVTGTMSPHEFETVYFEMYKNDNRHVSNEVFDIVDGFFAEVDAYVDDPALRDPADGDIGPDELKARARELLERAGFDVPPAD